MAEREAVSGHVTTIHVEPDGGGLVYSGACTCGWQGPRHPSGMAAKGTGVTLRPSGAVARARAIDDSNEHLRGLAPLP